MDDVTLEVESIHEIQVTVNKSPYIDATTGHWLAYSDVAHGFVDTGVTAHGETGPQGAKGEKGDVGATGAKGEKGATGEKGEQGESGQDGTNGADGKSAYQIAVDNGYEGDESEWIASLNGTDGIDGTNGINGADGYTPMRGTDYWNEEDVNSINSQIASSVQTAVDQLFASIDGGEY